MGNCSPVVHLEMYIHCYIGEEYLYSPRNPERFLLCHVIRCLSPSMSHYQIEYIIQVDKVNIAPEYIPEMYPIDRDISECVADSILRYIRVTQNSGIDVARIIQTGLARESPEQYVLLDSGERIYY